MTPAVRGDGPIDVRRAADRAVTLGEGVEQRHSFSFGGHYDPDNVGFASLLVHNDDLLYPGAGFELHAHHDVEIVTWVLSGSLVHQDSAGHHGVVSPGLVQRLSAGSGVRHTERNRSVATDAAGDPAPLRYVQMWLTPDQPGGEPGYDQLDVRAALATGELVPVVAGPGRYESSSALSVKCPGAALLVARLRPGQSVALPRADFLHVFVVGGPGRLHALGPGDAAVRLEDGDGARLRDTDGSRLTASGFLEVLVWELPGPAHS